MPDSKKTWCVITTYKENYLLLPAIVSFYKEFHGIPHFLIFCGLIEHGTHESLKKMLATKLGTVANGPEQTHSTPENRTLTVSEFASKDFVLWAASYPTKRNSSEIEWSATRSDLEKWAHRFLPAHIKRTILIDNDEFLHVKDPNALESLESLGFHFLDVVPCPQWPPSKLLFSLQGWYYRRQARPLYRYGGALSIAAARCIGRGLEHNGCKTFYFDRERLATGGAWHHNTHHSLACCYALDRFLSDTSACHEILKSTACCYHLGMTSREHFISQKLHLFSRIQTDVRKKPIEDGGRSPEIENLREAEKTFDRFIARSRFPVIEDNFLLPYLKNSAIISPNEL